MGLIQDSIQTHRSILFYHILLYEFKPNNSRVLLICVILSCYIDISLHSTIHLRVNRLWTTRGRMKSANQPPSELKGGRELRTLPQLGAIVVLRPCE